MDTDIENPPSIAEATYKAVTEMSDPQSGHVEGISSPFFRGLPQVGSISRTHELVDGCKMVLQLARATAEVQRSFCSQAHNYLGNVSEAVFFKRAKYFLILPMSLFLKADPPKVPDLPFTPTGAWRRWMRSRLVLNNQNCWLWYSFLQAKRTAQPVSKALVHQTYLEHRETMLLPDPLPDVTFEKVKLLLGPFLDQIGRRIHKEYSGDQRHEFDFEPSNSACWEETRSGGGAREALRSLVPALKSYSFDKSGKRLYPQEFLRMDFYPIVIINGTVHYNKMVEVFVDPPSIRNEWIQTLSHKLIGYRIPSIRNCEIQAVLEPLKVRVISKGESLPYYYSKKLQHCIHTVLRGFPCFSLIGKTIELSDLTRCRDSGKEFWKFTNSDLLRHFSVDYSAATDGLSARLSHWILRKLVKDFPVSNQEVWLSVLAPHHCSYPDLRYEGKILSVEPVDQQNGQLMGSILSFPVLCLANLGLYLLVVDEKATKRVLDTVLVNGDDMYYYGPKGLWDDHVTLGKEFGLRMSPGKAYCHPRYANMNSAMFDMKNDRYIPFFNGGLYKGQHKVLARVGDGSNSTQTIASVFNEMIRGVPVRSACDVTSQWLNHHRTALNIELKGRNLFIHESLGGMGQDAPANFKVGVTDWQRNLASSLLVEGKKLVPRTDPVIDIPEITPDLPCWAPKVEHTEKFVWPKGHNGYLSRNQCLNSRLDYDLKIPEVSGLREPEVVELDEFDNLSYLLEAVLIDHKFHSLDAQEKALHNRFERFLDWQGEQDQLALRRLVRNSKEVLQGHSLDRDGPAHPVLYYGAMGRALVASDVAFGMWERGLLLPEFAFSAPIPDMDDPSRTMRSVPYLDFAPALREYQLLLAAADDRMDLHLSRLRRRIPYELGDGVRNCVPTLKTLSLSVIDVACHEPGDGVNYNLLWNGLQVKLGWTRVY